MLGNQRRPRSLSEGFAKAKAPDSARKVKPKAKAAFDTTIHNLNEMALSPAQRKRREEARILYAPKHLSTSTSTSTSNQKKVQSTASVSPSLSPSPATTNTTATSKVPSRIPASHSSSSSLPDEDDAVVDLDEELRNFSRKTTKEAPVSKAASLRNTLLTQIQHQQQQHHSQPTKPSLTPTPNNKKHVQIDQNTSFFHPIIQNQLISLLESLETLSTAMNISPPPPTSTSTSSSEDPILADPLNPLFLLSHTLATATQTVSSATRLVQNNYLRTDSIASTIEALCVKVNSLEARLAVKEKADSAGALKLDAVQKSVDLVHSLVDGELGQVWKAVDSMRAECRAAGFGNSVMRTLRGEFAE
ncbi:hypothetical protein BCR33DRAFT_851268 [Rhizoclosmatium globosum]|uniref:Uncharacterized protein n=1 Tax=Rhizoclosmatium globosum TaxID=329046 RepID=A0A1Y2C7N9_9FUNG|nr:hypothetical protein BCR33DRAFT_851268 [Rhizoclosmatium globosum]|eukprot:ORY43040.1 hypothetical protein BCR33DRAFT_851268 [Rhizoclosmatium globosum]